MAARIQAQISRFLRSVVLALPMAAAVGCNRFTEERSMKGKWYLVGRLLGWGGLRLSHLSLHPHPAFCQSLSLPPRRSWEPGSGQQAWRPGPGPLCTQSCSACKQKALTHLGSWLEQLSAPSSRSHLNSQKCVGGDPGEDQACSSQKTPSFSFPGDSSTGSTLTSASCGMRMSSVYGRTSLPQGSASGADVVAADVQAMGEGWAPLSVPGLLVSLIFLICNGIKVQNTWTYVPYKMFILKHLWYISTFISTSK